MQGILKTAAEAKAFILAGNATVTFQSVKTSSHFTFKVRASEDGGVHFVSLLTGSDNEADYRYIGFVKEGAFIYAKLVKKEDKKVPNPITEDAPGVKAFVWTWKRISADVEQADVEMFHEGKCGRCGRKLTVPSSIATGLGPECASKMGFICEEAA